MKLKHFPEFPETWSRLLAPELIEGPIASLAGELRERRSQGVTIYPPRPLWFKALEQVPPDQVKVVVLGQDPYHKAGEAMGLSFSVPEGMKLPPSLRNIFKELHSDVGGLPPRSGDLTSWAEQGVLLLNSILTVEASNAGAHQGLGWEAVTDSLIQGLAASRQNLVFVLWGSSFAWKKEPLISGNHLIIKSAHPSPLSAYRGFFGSKPFSKANAYLIGSGQTAIDWQL